jgi:hypothetical protein
MDWPDDHAQPELTSGTPSSRCFEPRPSPPHPSFLTLSLDAGGDCNKDSSRAMVGDGVDLHSHCGDSLDCTAASTLLLLPYSTRDGGFVLTSDQAEILTLWSDHDNVPPVMKAIFFRDSEISRQKALTVA